MRAVILAGGLGTRLRPYTFTVPKPLLPLGNKALLDHLLDQLLRCGVSEVILALGYQAELVRAYFGNGGHRGLTIRYVQEREPLGTAGCLSLVAPMLDPDESILLVNGDLFTRLDFRAMAAFHASSQADLTIGYVDYTYRSPFGVLRLEGPEIVDIVEKPEYVHPVSAGIYCVGPAAIALVTGTRPLTMPELALAIRADSGRVTGYRIQEFWRALERPEHFEEMVRDIGAELEIADVIATSATPADAERELTYRSA